MKLVPLPPRHRLEGNLRLFIWFRLFFNARFYYPVFTILFLDFGLTLEQFAILNIAWALTIVLAEVPSGALADIVGRKRLLVFAAFLMFIEMGLLVVVPIGASPLLFWVFLFNRICSGLAEASASGADEALAYDSLKALGREEDWARILELSSRVLSIGFFVTMITGAMAYDADVINTVLGWFKNGSTLSHQLIIKLPVVLTLLSSVVVIVATLGMQEVHHSGGDQQDPGSSPASIWDGIIQPFRQVFLAARWTLNHRFVLFVILAALVLDSVARQFVVLASEYYRIIQISPAWFGFIGAGISLIGIGVARLSRHLATHHSPAFNFLLMSAILMTGLTGIMFTIPWIGILFAICAFIMMGMVSYQSSFHINREVDSMHRATVLSFRGLALNLGLGIASLLYTGLIAVLKASNETGMDPDLLQKQVFVDSLKAFPVYFLVLFASILVLGRIFIRKREVCFTKPS